jgi:hypothetical protein
MNRRVVSGLNAAPLVFWIAVFALIPTYALHEDLTSDGLRRTQAFLVLGYLLYPLFYGGAAFALFRLASMFQQRRDYITIDDDTVAFGRTIVPLADIREVDVRRNWLGLEQLVVLRNQAADYRVAAYALSRPICEVATELKAVVPTQTPR